MKASTEGHVSFFEGVITITGTFNREDGTSVVENEMRCVISNHVSEWVAFQLEVARGVACAAQTMSESHYMPKTKDH